MFDVCNRTVKYIIYSSLYLCIPVLYFCNVSLDITKIFFPGAFWAPKIQPNCLSFLELSTIFLSLSLQGIAPSWPSFERIQSGITGIQRLRLPNYSGKNFAYKGVGPVTLLILFSWSTECFDMEEICTIFKSLVGRFGD